MEVTTGGQVLIDTPNSTALRITNSDESGNKVVLGKDGSASFAGSVTSRDKFLLTDAADTRICLALGSEADDVLFKGFNDSGSVTSLINQDGSAMFTGNVDLQDSDKLRLGSSDDLQIYHDGTNSHIDNVNGTFFIDQLVDDGDLNIRCDNGSGGATTYVQCDGSSGAVKLHHYGNLKFETKSDGIDVTGEVQCDSLDVDGTVDITGNVQLHSNLYFPDNDQAIFGNGPDLLIYHDGSNSYIDDSGTGGLYIRAANTLGFRDAANSFNRFADFNSGGSIDLYYNGSKKLETKSDGVDITGELQCDSLDVDGVADISGKLTINNQAEIYRATGTGGNTLLALKSDVGGTKVTKFEITADGGVTLSGNLDLQDSDKILLGTGDDLQIYHDGNHSQIQDSGTGNLQLLTSHFKALSPDGSETYISAVSDGAVELYHNNSKKIETTSTGATITGKVTATGFDLASLSALP